MFLGDACNCGTFLFLDESTDIGTYLESLKKFKAEWMPRTDKLLIAHVCDEVPLDCIDNVIECCERILAHTDDREEFFHPLATQPAWWAAKGGLNRSDGKFGNVVYADRA